MRNIIVALIVLMTSTTVTAEDVSDCIKRGEEWGCWRDGTSAQQIIDDARKRDREILSNLKGRGLAYGTPSSAESLVWRFYRVTNSSRSEE